MTIDQEKELISIMIKIYEDGNKVDLSDLKNYAFKRIEFCPRKEEKTFCHHARFIAIKNISAANSRSYEIFRKKNYLQTSNHCLQTCNKYAKI